MLRLESWDGILFICICWNFLVCEHIRLGLINRGFNLIFDSLFLCIKGVWNFLRCLVCWVLNWCWAFRLLYSYSSLELVKAILCIFSISYYFIEVLASTLISRGAINRIWQTFPETKIISIFWWYTEHKHLEIRINFCKVLSSWEAFDKFLPLTNQNCDSFILILSSTTYQWLDAFSYKFIIRFVVIIFSEHNSCFFQLRQNNFIVVYFLNFEDFIIECY